MYNVRSESKISLGGSGGGAKVGGKELQTKTLQSALARMSNMFMGTLTIKVASIAVIITMKLPNTCMTRATGSKDLHGHWDEPGGDGQAGALPGEHRQVLLAGDVPPQEGEDRHGGGPEEPRQGGGYERWR